MDYFQVRGLRGTIPGRPPVRDPCLGKIQRLYVGRALQSSTAEGSTTNTKDAIHTLLLGVYLYNAISSLLLLLLQTLLLLLLLLLSLLPLLLLLEQILRYKILY